MEPASPKSTRRQRLREVTPYIVLAVGLLFTFVVSHRLAKVGEEEDRARFQVLVQDFHARIESRLESYTVVLRAGAGLFSANESVKESEFRTFVRLLGLAEHYPGVQGMSFSLRLKPDDNDTLEPLSAALRSRSAQVTGVSSVAQAIDAIKTSRPDVLVSDIAMPVEDGYQLIQKGIALRFEPRIPAIAITAYAKEEDKERALAAGYQRYLTKLVELGEFISAVAEAARNGVVV